MGYAIHELKVKRVLAALICGAIIGTAIGTFVPDMLDKRRNLGTHQKPPPGLFRSEIKAPNYKYSDNGLYATKQVVRGRIEGPVAMIDYHSTFVFKGRARVGAEVRDEIVTPPGALIHKFAITERGVWYDAKVKSKAEAFKDYRKIVSKGKDPGLIEFVDDHKYNFYLFPVLTDGTPKHAIFTQESLLNEENGWLSLPLWKCKTSITRWTVDLVLNEPRGIEKWELPAGLSAKALGDGKYQIIGKLHRLPYGPKRLTLRWKPQPGKGSLFSCQQSGHILQIPDVQAGSEKLMVSLLIANTPKAGLEIGKIYPRQVDRSLASPHSVIFPREKAHHLAVPEQVFVRLGAMAQIMRLLYTKGLDDKNEQIAKLALSHRIASPLTSLYAKPSYTKDDNIELVAKQKISTRQNSHLKAPKLRNNTASSFRSPVGSIDSLLTFRKSRERANNRACFANQKTIAGAIEMYNLDNNTDLGFDDFSRGLTSGFKNLTTIAALFQPSKDVLAEGVHQRTVAYGKGVSLNLKDSKRIAWLAPYFPTLQAEGYLQTIPDCPGEGKDSCTNYFRIGDEVFCLRHGFVRACQYDVYSLSARKQLQWAGIKDKKFLAMASPLPPHQRRNRGSCCFEFELLPALILIYLLWCGGWKAPKRYEKAALLTGLAPSVLIALGYSQAVSIGAVTHVVFPLIIIYAIYELVKN